MQVASPLIKVAATVAVALLGFVMSLLPSPVDATDIHEAVDHCRSAERA